MLESSGESELIYRGDNVMMGYATCTGDLAQEAQLGELATGDLAYRDEAGRYYLCGRLNRFLKLFGKRVSLTEVENQLHLWGWLGAGTGHDDNLLVVIEPQEQQRPDELQQQLASWLMVAPRAIRVITVDQLPRTANHKLDYAALAALVEPTGSEKYP
jgi:acyl-coenzyme A synthetase/AMP-(fatty) acid ligase